MAKPHPNPLIGVGADARPRVYIGHCRPDGAHWRVHPTDRPTFADSVGNALEAALAAIDAHRGAVIILEPM